MKILTRTDTSSAIHHRCSSSLSVDNTSIIPGFLTGSISVCSRRRRGSGRIGRATVSSDMMSGIVDCSVTPNTDLCSSPPSEPESDEDELLSSSDDESSDSEFSLEEADEDKSSFA